MSASPRGTTLANCSVSRETLRNVTTPFHPRVNDLSAFKVTANPDVEAQRRLSPSRDARPFSDVSGTSFTVNVNSGRAGANAVLSPVAPTHPSALSPDRVVLSSDRKFCTPAPEPGMNTMTTTVQIVLEPVIGFSVTAGHPSSAREDAARMNVLWYQVILSYNHHFPRADKCPTRI